MNKFQIWHLKSLQKKNLLISHLLKCKLKIEQVKWFQSQGGDVTIAVADLESQATRGVSLQKGREIALNEYISNYAALGLDA